MVLSSHVQEYATHSRDTSVLHTGATPLTRLTRFTRLTLLVTGTHGGHRHNAQKHNENNTNKPACLTRQHKQTSLLTQLKLQREQERARERHEAQEAHTTHHTPPPALSSWRHRPGSARTTVPCMYLSPPPIYTHRHTNTDTVY
jgi:hypothetical protein